MVADRAILLRRDYNSARRGLSFPPLRRGGLEGWGLKGRIPWVILRFLRDGARSGGEIRNRRISENPIIDFAGTIPLSRDMEFDREIPT